jgi:hypothetical protein
MKYMLVVTLFLAIISTAHAEEAIHVEKEGENQFYITLKAYSVLSVEDAQKSIYPSAVKACSPLFPNFEKYTFNATEPVASKNILLRKDFEFSQHIYCGDKKKNDKESGSFEITESEKKIIENNVEKKTNEYFSAINSGNFKNAYSMLSEELKSRSYSVWSAEKNEFSKSSGPKKGGDLWKFTTYVNPPNAPVAGIYVAVDYEFNYEHAPFHCGYVVWLKQNENYVLVREESGVIDEKTIKSMNNEQLEEVKRKFRCGHS